MLRGLGNALRALGDLVIPPGCAACGAALADGEYFCRDCAAEIHLLTDASPNQNTEENWTTVDNRNRSGSATAVRSRAVCVYGGPVGQAIRAFKYNRRLAAGSALGKWLAETVPSSWVSGFDMIIPVPLHRRRLMERGFNQAQFLFGPLAEKHHVRLESRLLKRLRYTKPQVGLHGSERQANVEGAFGVIDHDALKGKRLLLVDDVFTTGATVNECANVLLQTGAITISVLTLAKANTFPEMLN